MSANLFDAVIPGFSLHWDLSDLTEAMGKRSVLWTDPTNWMGRVVWLGAPFRYRYVLGDMTELAGAQDYDYATELTK
jgi:hypothetical protein